ncbi:hypothetical protein [Nitratiruptor sp. SB155-2]|uniref:hypothetical protein n=1 Tax=Nitratiruptor sp. (strain SB155-2) TaxID=387092 RepID=UPI00015873B3|nr:hypothetical protein [Nitratiruptor sp. SB155-2]BAF70483.1 conserved hypothetical protein [Nitratiruptor sp. SB155-2]
MYKIVMDKMCGCAKKDTKLHEKWLDKSFATKEEAEIEALRLANHANANWCKKHRFYAYEDGDQIRISVEMSCPKEI